MVKLQIFILSRDRPEYLIQTLDSVLTSSNGLAEVIVSDNSESDLIQTLLFNLYPNIKYIRRNPPVSAHEHFRLVIEQTSAEYIVLFHDDDLMAPQYVKTMLSSLDMNPDMAAVGCNALLMHNNVKTDERFMGCIDKKIVLSSANQLLAEYLKISQFEAAPFPSYMYRRKFLLGLQLDPTQGGKYSDLSFLIKLMHRGSILWVDEPLMWYRRHLANSSGLESIGDRLSLLRYIFANTGIRRASVEIKEYKFKYWLSWWSQRPGNHFFKLPATWRERVIYRFLLLNSLIYIFTKPFIWRKFAKKLFKSNKRPPPKLML